MAEQAEQKRMPILCPRTNKILGYFDSEGLYLFCRERGCHVEHRIVWSALGKSLVEILDPLIVNVITRWHSFLIII